jgi:hypothetical protein
MKCDEEGTDYISSYRSLYNAINVASQRLQLKLVTGTYEGIELANFEALSKALKNSYPSIKELFKKFPLRYLHYIDPQSKATMKSLTKHLEEQKLSLIVREKEWIVVPCSSPEMLTASTMKLMSTFQKLIDATRKKALLSSLDGKLRDRIEANKEITNKMREITNSITKIMQSRDTPQLKVEKILTLFETMPGKKDIVEMVLSVINEWLPDMGLPTTHDALCAEMKENNESLVMADQILSHLRMIPYDAHKSEEEYKLISRTVEILNLFVSDSLKLPPNLQVNICRLINTLKVGFSNNLSELTKNKFPAYRELVAELKRCYEINLTDGVKVTKKEGVTTSMPAIIELIDKAVVRREEISYETLIGYLGDLPELRKRVYKNLEKHHIEWSDEYFKAFFKDLEQFIPSQ